MASRTRKTHTRSLVEQQVRRLNLVITLISAAMLLLGLRLAYWQVLPHPDLTKPGIAASTTDDRSNIPRGRILDRNGALLAVDGTRYEIGVSPNSLANAKVDAQTIISYTKELSEYLHRPYDEIFEILNRADATYVPLTEITTTLPFDDGEKLQEMAAHNAWLRVVPHSYRVYPNGSLAAHVLGFVDLNKECGRYGIEEYYDQLLQNGSPTAKRCPSANQSTHLEDFGVGGTPQPHDSQVAEVVEIGMRTLPAPRDGVDLILTIDRGIQFLVEKDLDSALKEFRARRGTIIVMEPKTGNILAMANRPAYNPNSISQADLPNLSNYAVSATYEPGSTFKIITVANALKSGLFSKDSTYRDTGEVRYGGVSIHNWDGSAHGTVNLTQILGYSLNTGAAHLNIQLRPRRVVSYTLQFGFGKPTGIDLAREASGVVKVPGDGRWTEVDLAANAYGQGISVTPIQLATAVSAVANGGLLIQPHVVSAILDHGVVRQRSSIAVRRVLSKEIANELNHMLGKSIGMETKKALVPSWSVVGKTGTANVYINGVLSEDDFIGSFIGWAPEEDPQFLVLIVLEGVPSPNYWGSQSAAPVFQKVAWHLFHYMHIPPDQMRQVARASSSGQP